MKYKIIFCLYMLGIIVEKAMADDEIDGLTQNFFQNLEANLKDGPIDPYKFIDKQVNNYINLIQETHKENGHIRAKRGISMRNEIIRDNYAVYILNGLKPLNRIETMFPKDIMLFKQNSEEPVWYAAVLESRENDNLVILRYNGTLFIEIDRKQVRNGVRLGLHTVLNGTYIVAAENSKANSDLTNKTAIYHFNNEKLTQIQTLDIDYTSDIAIWQDNEDIFMAVTKQFSNESNEIKYEAKSTIYKYLGEHFDIIQQLNTSEAVRVTPFIIGNSHFLAIANRQNNNGESFIYSDIYKYDLHLGKFKNYQKIMTEGASDIKFFCFKSGNKREYFLVIANSFSKDEKNVTKYNAKSIIYKFIDDYFIPFQSFNLNGVTEWLPVVGPHGEFALLAACKFEGLKLFQYNGWHFVEAKNQYTDGALGAGILSMNSYIFQEKPVIVVSNENDNGEMINMYELCFREENHANLHYNELLAWCKKSLLDSDISQQSEIFKSVRQAPTLEDHELQLSEKATFHNLTVDNLYTLQDDKEELLGDAQSANTLQILENQVNIQKQQLQEIETLLDQASHTPQVNVIPGDLFAEEIQLQEDGFFNYIIAENIKDINVVDFLSNTININEDLALEKLELNVVRIEENFQPKTVNGHGISDMLYKNQRLELGDLDIKGNAIFENGVQLKTLNKINFTEENILLNVDDQTLNGNINVTNLGVVGANVKYLNKLPLSTIHTSKSVRISNIDNLHVKDIIIGGFINSVDLPTLNKYALRKTGNQEITADYIFDTLITEKINTTNYINKQKIPEDLILIDKGEFQIKQDVQFYEDLIVNNLLVSDRLNQINVERGKLDVLLKNITEMQNVSGLKSFENVELLTCMSLNANIKGKGLDKLNPVKRIEDHILVAGDFVIKGNVTVENILAATDIGTENFEYSLKQLTEKGLRLFETDIPMHLDFTQQLNVFEIFVDRINDIDPHSWVINTNNDTQYIKGWKIFEGDLFITGSTNLVNVNNIHLPEMDHNILKIDGDQIISGKHYIENIITESLKSKNVKLGPFDYHNLIVNNKEQTISGSTIINSLRADRIETNNVNVEGSINNVHFNDLLADTVFLDSTQKISGTKHFENITIDNLNSRRSINLNKIPSMLKKGDVVFMQSVEFLENLTIDVIKFQNDLNGISAEDFDRNWLTSGEDQNINGNQIFEKLVLYGNAFVESNAINGVSLTEISENSVKMDEEQIFNNISFKESLISLSGIQIFGHIEGLDINNIIADGGIELIITDPITFIEDVVVADGKLYMEGLINGFNLSNLCEFAEPTVGDTKKLIVNGNALFAKGPKVDIINTYDVLKKLETSWMGNREEELSGNLRFQEIYFEDDVVVQGYVGEVNLALLRDTYFSKTKNQSITAKLDFNEGIKVDGDIFALEAKLEGSICNIKLANFLSTAILQDMDQIFEDIVFLETCKINDLRGEFLVNTYNLQTDLMRYDMENIVTGKKIIQDVSTDLLRINRNFQVQNVDLLNWISLAILKSGGNFRFDGRLQFDNTTVFKNGIGLKGLLNQMEFNENNIMLKSVPQKINGKKIFQLSSDPNIFKDVKVNGLVNNVNIVDMLHAQAFKHEDTIFQSEMILNTEIKAANVNIDAYYQGINITQLIYNLTNYVSLNNYFNNYEMLYGVSKKIQESLKTQAHYLHHYRTIQIFDSANDMFFINNFYPGLNLVVLRNLNQSNMIDFFRWDSNTASFLINADSQQIVYNDYLSNLTPLEYKFGSYLYIEHDLYDEKNHNSKMGNILGNINSSAYEIVGLLYNNGTKDILPLTLPDTEKSCTIMLYHFEPYMDIYCDDDDLKLHQRIFIPKAISVKTMIIDGCLYIIAINQVSIHKESCVIVWIFDKITGLFMEHQHIFIVSPNSITTISYKGIYYLAIGSGHLMNTLYPGQVDIKRFDPKSKFFTEWQQFSISTPIQVEFAILPSKELILYILCDNSVQPLVIYKYEGISKFALSSVVSSLSKCYSMSQFSDGNNHFVITKATNEFRIIQAMFKGYNYA